MGKMAINTAKGWIDDEIADAILTLAKLPTDQGVIPRELIEQAVKARDDLDLIEFALK